MDSPTLTPPTPVPTTTSKPTVLPTLFQGVDWGKNCSYTTTAQTVSLTIEEGRTEHVTTIPKDKEKVFIDLSATGDLDIQLVSTNGTVRLPAYT